MVKGSGGRGKQKWVPKGSEKEVEKEGKENEEGTESTGPKYDRHQLLRTRTGKDDGALMVLQEANTGEAKELHYGLEARPEDEGTGKSKAKQRSNSMLDEAAEGPSGQPVQLHQELADSTPSAGADPALMTYVQNMMTAFGVSAMYGPMGYPGYTTVMLRNIPNRYTRDMLISRLDKGYEGEYDFVYLPIDFSSRCNVGYAFINFRTPPAAQRFISEFHGAKTKHCLPGFGSAKIAEVSYARVQGREQNMDNLRDEKFIEKLNDRPDWQPLFLDDAGKEIPFSKAFGGERKRSKKAATPNYIPPTTPTGFMRPPPYFPVYPSFGAVPPAPPTTLASVLPSASKETLLMLRGVPLAYTRQQLLDKLKSKYDAAFNFLYLPNKTEPKGNRGFAFINFNDAQKAKDFTEDFAGKTMKDCFQVEGEEDKACEVHVARMESLERSIERLQTQVLSEEESKEGSSWLPVLIGAEGEVQPFPTLSAAEGAASARKAKPAEQKAEDAPEKAEADPKPKAKPKDKKAAKDATPASYGYSYPYGMPYMGFPGYPGYAPPYPGYPAATYQTYAQMAAAQTRALQGKSKGRKGGEKGFYPNVLDTMAAAVNLKEGDEQLTPESREKLKHQVEFYFSTNNLCKDLFLRQHMEPDGWTSLELIAQFPMVRKFKVSIATLIEVLTQSDMFEIDQDARKLRLADEKERRKWAQAPAFDGHIL
ncbi:unnamed protein product [Effrenium voratum]|uniref:RNA-binding protein n=1 Tax=Effrenium voratum TaxID=2562239 RepID=A0AA36J786_9DINO|nr:unnamed protein product [Effrenium voratum]